MKKFYVVSLLLLCSLSPTLSQEIVQKASENGEKETYASNSQPRLYTNNGNLIFETGTGYNISMKTNGGSVNLNDKDLTALSVQIETNQADIQNLKDSGAGGSIPQDVLDQIDTNKQNIQTAQDQINDHNVKIQTLENNYSNLKTTVDGIVLDLQNDECSSNPCTNGGTCVDLYKSYLCQCPNQWQGPQCQTDVNECSQLALSGIGCQNGGTCVNTPGSFRCDCTAEFFGPFCTSEYNDCSDGSAKCMHGICVDGSRDQVNVPKYSCVCEDGWQNASPTDPTCSLDVNECLDTPCSRNPQVPCYNTPGSFTCDQCPIGYVGNGIVCTDVDECATNNGGCSTNPMVQCINQPGTSTCGPCPAGYTGDGRYCAAQDPCSSNNGGCHPIATCTTNPAIGPSYVQCTCPPGYSGNGVGPNGCTLNPTDCSSSCQNGQCLDNGGGWQMCICDPGWSGDNCDTNINECASAPCQNGATCQDIINGYVCQCTDGFSGLNCENQESSCGAYYRQDSGAFSFPATSGQNYPNGANCAWVVEVQLGKIIQATFPIFDIESSSGCSNDFLQINDGNSASARLVGKYCGTTAPGNPLLSTHNMLYFWFNSNSQTNGQGFQVVWQTTDPVCGGDISGETFGDFASPGYPGSYPNSRDCYWTIQVEPGHVVQLLFGTLDLEDDSSCSKDYLEIRNGVAQTDALLGIFCGSTTPAPLLTTAPGAWIYLHTDDQNTAGGFHITWASQPVSITGCGGYLTDNDGIITSPNWPSPYELNQECFWQIHVETTGRITIEITDLEIEDHNTCNYDYVEVRDGPSEVSPLVSRYCGNQPPPPYTSSGNDLWIKFKSDVSNTGSGFRMTYTVACGGTYTAPTGTLVSPFYPLPYPENKECYYLISQSPGYVITLQFNELDLENHSSCDYDFIEIRDGPSEDSPLLSTLCGSSVPVPVETSQNFMWIHFSSDFVVNGNGFSASYTTHYTGCGGVYNDPVGTFTSPGQPVPYPNGANCTYYIAVDPALIINLHFIQFNLEAAGGSGCYDYIEIFDGEGFDAPSLGRFCGDVPPPEFTSTSYELTIYFTADASITTDGFVVSYTTTNASTSCGDRITNDEGYITSSMYPDNYLPDRTCVWTIQADTNMQIRVNFTDFALEAGDADGNCIYDYLELRNGGYEDSALIGTYCGSNSPGIFVTHGNQLYMKFHSDPLTEDRGFLMFYDGSLRGCGGTLTSSNGYFESPNYPYPYAHNAECYWIIEVSEGSAVSLQFNTFDLETHGYCSYDYVEVYDGPSPGYPLLQRICGTQIPQQFQSSGNYLTIKFKSDVNTAGSGFTAFYSTICTRTISDQASGIIQSLDYPNNYPVNLDCEWHIQGTYGNKINVSINYFSMETCDNCACDYLQIHDGEDTSTGSDIGKFCGSTYPSFFQSTTSDLIFSFHTDPYVSAPGFEVVWAVDGCGATFNEPSGTLTSPNYPNNYPNSKECIWQIITSPGTSVKLTITVFDVEHHSDCVYDVLEVYNGLTTDPNNRLTQLCNAPDHDQRLPLVVSSTSTFMTVRFITDSSINGKGFSSTWEEQPGLCGGSFASPSGTITSPNYPNNYPANEDCEWYIDVGPGNTVILEFETFDIEPVPDCTFDYVAVYAGNSTSDPLMLKACGSYVPDPIQSPGNLLFVQFHSDPYSTHTGFKANFRSGCGGYLVATEDGSFTSPNYPDQYPADTNCTWTILAPELDGHVTLTMTHLDLYYNPDINESACGNYDFLEVRDGASLTAPIQNLYCGRTVPAPITSFSEALTVTFVSKSQYQASGFRALYTSATSRCGGDLTGAKGYFNSPGYPGPYPTYATCVWTITSSPGNGIHLQFLSFDLESHSSCYYDYVEVREGSETGPLLAKLCGNEIPSNLTTVNGHVLYIKFASDVSITGDGFQAYYEHVYGGTIIGEPNGIITSPMYPSNYPNYVDAYYYIYADFGNFISYHFTVLDLEEPASAGCIYDYVGVYDGDSLTSPPLIITCGYQYVTDGSTTQSAMLVYFHSDWGYNSRGFYMTWEQVEGGGIPPNPTNVPTIAPGQCGADQMVAAVYPNYFQSPGWPIQYDLNQECVWHIDAAENYAIVVQILEMELEGPEETCPYDYVRFYDGETDNDVMISQYCGRLTAVPVTVTSTSNHMTIKFRSDSSVMYKGFNMSYQQTCGGFIQAELGAFSSPLYPNNYPSNIECVWVVLSTVGSTLNVVIDSNFNIQNSDTSTCNGTNGDFLQLLNGRDVDSPPLTPNNGDGNGYYCGTSSPQSLQTQSNGLFVRFKTDDSGTGAGFSLSFTANRGSCGSILTLTDQVTSSSFFSPDYPSTYPDGADCYWLITVPAGEAVQLDFTEFNVESHPSCAYDYVEVIDGRTGDEEILGKFCGNEIPATTVSSGNEMTVHFRSDPSVPSGGFKADYSIATCGGTIVGLAGEVISPDYPNAYPSSTVCEWRIRGPVYHYISFQFNDLHLNQLADGASCGDGSGDYVEFRTSNFTGPLLYVACGSAPPVNSIDTPDNEGYIRFVTDGSGTSTGFNISFAASEDECGGELTGPGGTLQTPNYPNAYDHSRVCTWLITVAVDRRISLQFNSIDIEGDYGGTCYYDYVEVFNGINDNSPSLSGRFCGTTLPPIIDSTGNTMKVVFSTDASVSNGGFIATYTSNLDRVCGGRISSSEGGSITSPNYPSPYGANQECLWVLENTNTANSTIRLSFDAFSLEDHQTCDYDYILIKAGSTYDSPTITKLCGMSIPADVGTAYDEMLVQFVSDPLTNDLGFSATFDFTACGGYISGQTGGVITTPNYPNAYNTHDFCLWTIAVAPGERIDLLWTDFELEQHNNCQFDYLKLYNGPTTSSPLIDTFCGDNQPTQFQSGGNFVTLLFQSDVSVQRGGWRMEWSTHTSGCGNILFHDDVGTLTSPNYPDNYPHNSDCVWQILGKPSYHIEVTFDIPTFDVEYSGSCTYDYVALYDGAYEATPIIAKYCGDSEDINAPPSTAISSSKEDMTVRFRSDSSIFGTGFTMDWITVCGQTLSNEMDVIQSPNYPSPYNVDERCEFLITFNDASEKFIKLQFLDLDVEAGSNPTICNYDYVNIYGGNTTSAALIGSFCGSDTPSNPISSQGSMLVVFNSDSVITDVGFQARYESSDCGGILTDASGTINAFTHSDIHNNRNCTWQIEISDAQKIIEMKFATFDLEAHSNCIYDYVAIYDGFDTSAPMIGKYCGTSIPEFIHSTGNTMTIEYYTDDLITGDGFTAAYKAATGPAEGCGGIISDDSGTLMSPDLDNDGNYDSDLNCVWKITTSLNTVVNLHFNSFRLENESSPGNCIFDKLEIRDGLSYADPLVLSTCGVNVPADFTSSSNQVTVRFVADPFIEDTGFEIQYSSQPQTCGGSYDATDNFQTVTSPDIDSQSTGLSCRWVLNAGDDSSKLIEIEFDALDIQNSENPPDDCTAAYVEIRDYPLGDNGQVRKYCGSDIPENFLSFQQVVQVNLYTDASTTGSGFTFRYKLASCSRSLILANGQLFSPGWPDAYDHNLNCETTIEAPSGYKLMIFFNFFDVEFETNCNYDHLEIRDGLDSSATLLTTLCGDYLPDPVFPSSNQAYLKLLTDPATDGAGYDITFTSSPSGCGGNITGDHGSVHNYMYPQPYEPNLDCEYVIRTPKGRPVTVHITLIDLFVNCTTGTCYCQGDSLTVYGGSSNDAPRLGGWCGYGTLTDLQSPTNAALIRLRTTDFEAGSRTNTGFRIDYES